MATPFKFAKDSKILSEAMLRNVNMVHICVREQCQYNHDEICNNECLREHACNRCMYAWDGNNGICPMCGNESTHERGMK